MSSKLTEATPRLRETRPGRRRVWAGCALALLTATLSWGRISTNQQEAGDASVPPAPGSGPENGVNPSILPGDDFFSYANGAWLASTEIPAGKERWTARNEIDETTRRQVERLLEDAAAAPVGSTARKVADFRAAYANEAAIEARGLASLAPLLDRIEHVGDRASLTRLLGSDVGADVDPLNWGIYDSSHLLGLAVGEGNHGEKGYVAFLVQGGLGLPDREAYISAEPRAQALRAQYQRYVERMLALAGFQHAAPRAAAVMALETAIAKSHATAKESANDHNADNLWTRADFARQAPGTDWSAFFAAAGAPNQASFVVWQPSAVTGAAALIASQSLETWKDYVRFHTIDRYADVLPRAFAEQALQMRAATASGQPQIPRAQRALAATQLAMSDAIGKVYSESYFPPEEKARVQAIVANVIAAFSRRVEAVTWMSPDSKTMALAKLKKLYVGVGYPEKWQDYSDLVVDSADALANLSRVADRNYRRTVARLGQPVDMKEWGMAPQTVGAVLVFQQNAYNFAAALLQAPKFDPAASEAANYGSIGAIVGHEVSHTVDTLGAEYDADGGNIRWWTPQDFAGYQASTAPLVDQFSGYRPFPDASVNGKLTLTENVADLGGLTAAFEAYRLALGSRSADREYLRQQDRQFFIGFARSWRSKIREDALRTQLASNDHAPEMYRISTVRNLDAWYEAFDVLPGQRLYLEPKARVRVW